MNEEELKEKAALHIPNFAVGKNGLILFEHLKITQDGYLTKWIFTAEDLGEGDGRTQYPDLHIYRPAIQNDMTSIVFTLPGHDVVLTNNSNVYEYAPQTAMQVKTGYFIAITLPSISNARLLLSFVRNSGPSGTDIGLGKRDVEPLSGREGDLPLITLEISNDILTPHV